jgi:hypothetical protein
MAEAGPEARAAPAGAAGIRKTGDGTGPGERYGAGSWPLRASSRAAILATAAACELVSGGSSAASAAAHALRPCSRDTRPESWPGRTSSAFFPGGSVSPGACGAGSQAGDVPVEGDGTPGESPAGELGVARLFIGGPAPLHPARSRRPLPRADLARRHRVGCARDRAPRAAASGPPGDRRRAAGWSRNLPAVIWSGAFPG